MLDHSFCERLHASISNTVVYVFGWYQNQIIQKVSIRLEIAKKIPTAILVAAERPLNTPVRLTVFEIKEIAADWSRFAYKKRKYSGGQKTMPSLFNIVHGGPFQ